MAEVNSDTALLEVELEYYLLGHTSSLLGHTSSIALVDGDVDYLEGDITIGNEQVVKDDDGNQNYKSISLFMAMYVITWPCRFPTP